MWKRPPGPRLHLIRTQLEKQANLHEFVFTLISFSGQAEKEIIIQKTVSTSGKNEKKTKEYSKEMAVVTEQIQWQQENHSDPKKGTQSLEELSH